MNEKFTIKPLQEQDISAVQDFLMYQLETLFDQQGQKAITGDIWGLKNNYIDPPRHQMWVVYNEEEKVVGTIAICQYNDRIEILKGRYSLEKTAEIGRCYIDESLRRQGIGGKLLKEVENFCRENGYDIIYLHTHHFLPGGYNFWKKNGFDPFADVGGKDQIVHMEKRV